ncbi:MAG: type transport system permease protein [Ilumatobacteraceae bacterium]|jgi:ABC-type transport system involved in multi-copper enzyme maturation permease subunit
MITIVKAELQRLVRRRFVFISVAGTFVFAIVAALAVFSSAQGSGVASRRGGTTLAALAGHGGATEAFAVAASFTGFLVFVTFIAMIATEFSGGTFRALVMRNPHRVQVIAGKLIGILVVAAGALAMAEVWTVIASMVMAPAKNIATGNWFSMTSLADAVRDYATVFGGVIGWAVFGTMLAVIFRSAPLALGVGFAWAGPFENIISRSWSTGYRVFPGQVLGSLIEGGTTELGLSRAVFTASIYALVAATIALVLVSRRDVTS